MLVDQCQKITADQVIRQAMSQIKKDLLTKGVEISDQSVQLTATKTQFGGQRIWFTCPGCTKRRGALMVHPISNQVGCRDCLNVQYRKQRYKGMIEAENFPQ